MRLEEISCILLCILGISGMGYIAYDVHMNDIKYEKLREARELHERTCERETLVVRTVGGCNKYGGCGVLFDNGTHGYLSHPVPGQIHSRCKI